MKIPLFKSQDIILLTPLDLDFAHQKSPSTSFQFFTTIQGLQKNIFNLTVIKDSSMPLKSSNTSIVSVINYYLNKIEIYYIQIQYIESIFNILKNISIYKLKLNFNICTLYVPLTPQRGYFYVLRTGLWTERTIIQPLNRDKTIKIFFPFNVKNF